MFASLTFGTALDAMMIVDADRRFRHLNPPATQLLGASREAILGARIDDFTPDDSLTRLESLWAQLNRDGTLAGTYELLRGDGVRSLVEFRALTEFDAGQHLIVARPVGDVSHARFNRDPEGQSLTAREREVLQLAADGRLVREIADDLFVSVGTIRTHFQHIHAKLGVSNRAAAVALGFRLGLID